MRSAVCLLFCAQLTYVNKQLTLSESVRSLLYAAGIFGDYLCCGQLVGGFSEILGSCFQPNLHSNLRQFTEEDCPIHHHFWGQGHHDYQLVLINTSDSFPLSKMPKNSSVVVESGTSTLTQGVWKIACQN